MKLLGDSEEVFFHSCLCRVQEDTVSSVVV